MSFTAKPSLSPTKNASNAPTLRRVRMPGGVYTGLKRSSASGLSARSMAGRILTPQDIGNYFSRVGAMPRLSLRRSGASLRPLRRRGPRARTATIRSQIGFEHHLQRRAAVARRSGRVQLRARVGSKPVRLVSGLLVRRGGDASSAALGMKVSGAAVRSVADIEGVCARTKWWPHCNAKPTHCHQTRGDHRVGRAPS
jgi:hypothetical protein